PYPERVMPALDIFAMSSDTEQMPIGLLEAMACGLPVVATNVGDIVQMIAEENRSLVSPSRSAEPLAGALNLLISNQDLRERLGAANLGKARAEYDQSTMFQHYAHLFG